MTRLCLSGLSKRSNFVAVLLAMQIALCIASSARAGHDVFHIFTPTVEKGEWGVEFLSGVQMGFPKNSDEEKISAAHELGIHSGLTNFWLGKIALGLERQVGGDYTVSAVTTENVVRFFEQRPGIFDAAWFTALSVGVDNEASNSVEFGPIFSLSSGRFNTILNPFLEKTFGANREDGLALAYAWRATYEVTEKFSLGFEGYGEVENLSNAPAANDQIHRLGPVLYLGRVHGKHRMGHKHDGHEDGSVDHMSSQGQVPEWNAEIGILFGLTDATPETALKLNLEAHF